MNITQLAGDLDLEEEEYRAILDLFIEASHADLVAIKAAIATGDAQGAGRAAHSLKGAAANLGLSDASGAAREIEDKARDSRLHETRAAVASLEAHLAAVEELFDRGKKVPEDR
jgi:HPt (histidine-containing phosphotransfer) domain-containing protein